MDGEKIKDTNEYKVGLNVMRQPTGTFSLEEIIRDQSNLEEKEKRKCLRKNNIYYKIINSQEVYVISPTLAEKLVKELHDKNKHVGIRKLHLIFRENYICKKDINIIKNVTRTCRLCQLGKEKNSHNFNIPKSILTNRPLEIVSADFVSNLIPSRTGSKHIFVIIDNFSKYIFAYPCIKTNTKTVKRCLTKFILEHGSPRRIIMDNATYFQNENLKIWLQKSNITPTYTSIRHPNSNAAERAIKELIKYLRLFTYQEQDRWEDYLEDIVNYMNSTPNTITQQPPSLILKNKYPERPWIMERRKSYDALLMEVNENLKKNHDRYLKRQNSKIKKKIVFKKDELVILKALRTTNKKENVCAKLQLLYEGPYKIDNEFGVNSYRLIHPDTGTVRGIFHVSQLYRFHT